jgi:biotin synthase
MQITIAKPSPVKLETHTFTWDDLATQVLGGEALLPEQALAVLNAPDEDVLEILAAAYRVRRKHFGNTVQLYYLMNVKSGLCPEDCGYCSQSKVSKASIEKYPMLDTETILNGAHRAADSGACTFCIVASGRGPTDRELDQVIDAVEEIKSELPLRICACLGILKPGQAERLEAAGVDRYNHNLNTGEEFHHNIVNTHTFQDRVRTVESIKAAGISPCSGGIVGMGERSEDVVDMAYALRDLEIESIPVNFFIPIEGTPFAGVNVLTPQYCLKTLAMFRLVNPTREIRIAGGREVHLRTLQPLGLYAANSIFVSDYLTTKGQTPEEDYAMLRDLGFSIVRPQNNPDPAQALAKAS